MIYGDYDQYVKNIYALCISRLQGETEMSTFPHQPQDIIDYCNSNIHIINTIAQDILKGDI